MGILSIRPDPSYDRSLSPHLLTAIFKEAEMKKCLAHVAGLSRTLDCTNSPLIMQPVCFEHHDPQFRLPLEQRTLVASLTREVAGTCEQYFTFTSLFFIYSTVQNPHLFIFYFESTNAKIHILSVLSLAY